MMFTLGTLFIGGGYAFIYTALANFFNGGNGPNLFEALGFKQPLARPGADKYNGSILAPGAPNGPNVPGSQLQ